MTRIENLLPFSAMDWQEVLFDKKSLVSLFLLISSSFKFFE